MVQILKESGKYLHSTCLEKVIHRAASLLHIGWRMITTVNATHSVYHAFWVISNL